MGWLIAIALIGLIVVYKGFGDILERLGQILALLKEQNYKR